MACVLPPLIAGGARHDCQRQGRGGQGEDREGDRNAAGHPAGVAALPRGARRARRALPVASQRPARVRHVPRGARQGQPLAGGVRDARRGLHEHLRAREGAKRLQSPPPSH
eukprot:4662239-Prymnesium_polylepis.1